MAICGIMPGMHLPDCADADPIWCGPYIVALLLGISYRDAYRLLLEDARRAAAEVVRAKAEENFHVAHPDEVRAARQRVTVTGTHPHHIARVLTKRGVPTSFLYTGKRGKGVPAACPFDGVEPRPTLLQFARQRPVGTFLIDVADHWVVIEDGVMYNSQFDPVPVEDAPRYRKARVLAWAEVEPHPASQ